jgi:hypothetical protein
MERKAVATVTAKLRLWRSPSGPWW